MLQWYELVEITSILESTIEEDNIMWAFSSTGTYRVQSLYAIITHRGVLPVYTPTIWKLNIPPRVQFVVWLLANNRLPTRDNLAKRRTVDMCCVAKSV